jgi:predicted nucleic acid-binding protein
VDCHSALRGIEYISGPEEARRCRLLLLDQPRVDFVARIALTAEDPSYFQTLIQLLSRRSEEEVQIAMIQGGRAHGYVASTNLAEFYYKVCQKLGQETATVRFHQTQTILEAVETDGELAKAAGLNKCRYGHLSLVDAFAAALTEKLGGTLLTTDEALLKVTEIRVKHFDA